MKINMIIVGRILMAIGAIGFVGLAMSQMTFWGAVLFLFILCFFGGAIITMSNTGY